MHRILHCYTRYTASQIYIINSIIIILEIISVNVFYILAYVFPSPKSVLYIVGSHRYLEVAYYYFFWLTSNSKNVWHFLCIEHKLFPDVAVFIVYFICAVKNVTLHLLDIWIHC